MPGGEADDGAPMYAVEDRRGMGGGLPVGIGGSASGQCDRNAPTFYPFPALAAASGPFGGLYSAGLVHPARIKQSASSVDISTMRSSPMVICRPESVWTAPIPGGALRRT